MFDGGPFVFVDAFPVLRRDTEHQINIRGQQVGHAGGHFGNRPEDQGLNRRHGLPILLIGSQGDAIILDPFSILKGTSADRGILCATFLQGFAMLRCLDATAGAGHFAQERRFRGGRDKLDIEGIDHVDLSQESPLVVGDHRLVILDALIGPDHRIGIKGLAIVEGDPFAQLHAPGGLVNVLPGFGQPRLEFGGFAVAPDQAVKDIHVNPGGGNRPVGGRIERGNQFIHADGDRVTGRGFGRRGHCCRGGSTIRRRHRRDHTADQHSQE